MPHTAPGRNSEAGRWENVSVFTPPVYRLKLPLAPPVQLLKDGLNVKHHKKPSTKAKSQDISGRTFSMLPLLRRTIVSIPRQIFPLASVNRTMSSSISRTPVEDLIKSKIEQSLSPTRLEIHNDSHKHAHHEPMAGSTSKETHFRLLITSAAFEGKRLPARHRMVNALLKDEMAREGGIHALQLKTVTPAEEEEKGAVAPSP